MALTYTYSQQHRPFPTSGNALTEDGSPLHSRLGVDMMTSVNNLNYSMPFAGFAMSPYPGGSLVAAIPTVLSVNTCISSTEWLAAQLPTVLPKEMGRFCWTMGLYLFNATDSANTVELDDVTVYLSPSPYSGSNLASFDATKLGSPYTSSVAGSGFSISTVDPVTYVFLDMSAGTAATIPAVTSYTSGGLARMNLVVTTTAHRTSGGAASTLDVGIADFNWWILPQ